MADPQGRCFIRDEIIYPALPFDDIAFFPRAHRYSSALLWIKRNQWSCD
jgi:hypothetical protein